jgi:hypothetical protein
MNLVVSHIQGDYVLSTAFQQDLSEPTRGSTHVQNTETSNVEFKQV